MADKAALRSLPDMNKLVAIDRSAGGRASGALSIHGPPRARMPHCVATTTLLHDLKLDPFHYFLDSSRQNLICGM